jgi:hypothetical protein
MLVDKGLRVCKRKNACKERLWKRSPMCGAETPCTASISAVQLDSSNEGRRIADINSCFFSSS